MPRVTDEMSTKKAYTAEEAGSTAEPMSMPSLADQLRERRTRILRESQQKIRKIDSALRMLEQTDAEKSVADAKEVLSDVW